MSSGFQKITYEEAFLNTEITSALGANCRCTSRYSYSSRIIPGLRRSELLGDNRRERLKEPLRWDHVDFEAKRIYLGRTKNSEPRLLPFIGDIGEWLLKAWEDHDANWPDCPYVIQRGGKPVFDPRKTWNQACEAAGVPSLWRHDLRRSAVRNLDRAGVSRKVAMAISGHKTNHVYSRYNIVSNSDLDEAATKVDGYLKDRGGRTVTKMVTLPRDEASEPGATY